MELKEATVMVVDDEPMLLDIFGEWLQEENCRVLTAGDGVPALQSLRNHYVDVIVSDVTKPGCRLEFVYDEPASCCKAERSHWQRNHFPFAHCLY
jgi:CheY-like chemotaxis protein